jgi:hypothetical protein
VRRRRRRRRPPRRRRGWRPSSPRPLLRGGDPDDHDAEERDRAAGDERAREALSEQEAGKQRDEDRADVHEHRRRARIHSLLGLVQGQVVEPEPEDAADDDARPVAATRKPATLKEDEDAEQSASDREPAEAERPR